VIERTGRPGATRSDARDDSALRNPHSALGLSPLPTLAYSAVNAKSKTGPKEFLRSFGSPTFTVEWARSVAFRPRLIACLTFQMCNLRTLCT
jgi:hypothetical protein